MGALPCLVVEPKRRLPLLKPAPGEAGGDDAPVRPPWQWVGFGALAIFVVLLPLSWLATLAAMRLQNALPFAAALALSGLGGGYLIGRWGTAGVGVREAALAGLAASIAATAMAWGGTGAAIGSVVTAFIAVPAAALGGRLGLRAKAESRKAR
jgi:hypothetical protein